MAAATAQALGIAPDEVVVCSTGVIGKPLPMDAVEQGIAQAAGELSRAGGAAAADAIRTTDAWAKTSTATCALSGGEVRIGVMGKGAGMIRPDVATTIVTPRPTPSSSPACSQSCCAQAADASLNLVSVDGSESTNDTLVVLASGASGVTRERRRRRGARRARSPRRCSTSPARWSPTARAHRASRTTP